MCKPGDCFWIQSGYYKDGTPKYHLFVVVIPFFPSNDYTILISFSRTEGQPQYDTTTVINGPHPKLPDLSYAAYYKAMVKTRPSLHALIDAGRVVPDEEPVSMSIVEELRRGIEETDQVPIGVQDIYDDYKFSGL